MSQEFDDVPDAELPEDSLESAARKHEAAEQSAAPSSPLDEDTSATVQAPSSGITGDAPAEVKPQGEEPSAGSESPVTTNLATDTPGEIGEAPADDTIEPPLQPVDENADQGVPTDESAEPGGTEALSTVEDVQNDAAPTEAAASNEAARTNTDRNEPVSGSAETSDTVASRPAVAAPTAGPIGENAAPSFSLEKFDPFAPPEQIISQVFRQLYADRDRAWPPSSAEVEGRSAAEPSSSDVASAVGDAPPSHAGESTATGARPMPRMMVLVNLANPDKVVEDELEKAAQAMANAGKQIADSVLNEYVYQLRMQMRAITGP